MKRAKTVILVTVIAALIWAFAEGESLQSQRTVAEVGFVPLSGGVWATRVIEGQGWTGRVEVQIEGPTAGLDALDSVLREVLMFEPGTEALPKQSGEQLVDLRQALRDHPEFSARGVSVVSAEPATVRVRVEELATLTLPIRVEAPTPELEGPGELVGADEASVRVPAASVDAVGDGAAMVARVTPNDLAALPERVRSTVRVRLTPGPGLSGVEVHSSEPQQAEVRLTVRSKTSTVVLRSVPVDIRLPSGVLGEWDVRIPAEDEVIENVTVTGPSDLIAEIESGNRRVWAYVRLSYEDLQQGITSQRAEFSGLPTSLTFSAEDLNVELDIRPRQASRPTAGDGETGG